jgi:hypothetical protein
VTDAEIKARFLADFLRVNGLEPVIHGRVDDQGVPNLTLEIPKALWRGSEKNIILTHVVVAAKDVCWWHVPVTQYELAGVEPRTETDFIQEPLTGRMWAIKEIRLQTWRTRYKFTCIKAN